MEKTWLKHYPEGVPAEIDPDQYTSLIDIFERSTAQFANQPAFINMGQVMTFRELEEKSRAFAAYLQHGLGLKQGDRIALMMPNLLQYPIAMFGILRAGMVVVNVNPLYTARELEHQLCDSGAAAIVVVANFAGTLEKVIQKTAVKHVILTHLGDQLSAIKGTVVNFVVKYVKRLVPQYHLPGAISFCSTLNKGQHLHYVKPAISNDTLAFLQYTGGTTGIAKGAMLTHRNLQANLHQAKAAYGSALRVGQEWVVTALPLYHIFALTVNCLLFLELGGKNLLITNPRDIPGFVKELIRYPVTVVIGVNTLFNALLNNTRFCNLNFSTLRLAAGGGMSIQRAVAERWKNLTGVPLLEGYGLTECSPLVTACPHTQTEYNGSIGFPVSSTEIRLVDENGHDVAAGESGELLVKGPQVMKGYWQRPEATADVLNQGWLSTGDIVQLDERGLLYLIDRKKDLILISGFNVYPNEIEDVVAMNDKVLEVAAVGVPDENSGEAVKIYVVKRDMSLTREELITYCRSQLTGYKVPKWVEFRDELPKSTVGKILRRELRDQEKMRSEHTDKPVVEAVN